MKHSLIFKQETVKTRGRLVILINRSLILKLIAVGHSLILTVTKPLYKPKITRTYTLFLINFTVKFNTMAETSTDSAASTTDTLAGTSTPATESSAQDAKLPESKRWADVSDDEKDDLESKIDSLAIEEPKKVNEFLEDPEPSNIQAVLIFNSCFF